MNIRLPAKAIESHADVVLFDLEDSVLPNLKAQARDAVIGHLADSCPIRRAVRLNPLGSLDGLMDLTRLIESGKLPDILILSKPALSAHIELASAILSEAGHRLRLYPIIESARSLWELARLESAPAMLAGAIFGAADFSSEMGVDQDEADFSHVKREIALHCQRLGIDAIDSPCFTIGDHTLIASESEEARRIGYAGKIAIHPGQIETINRHFTPSGEKERLARALLRAKESQPENATFVFRERMVGPPFLKRAQEVCAVADALNENVK